MGIGPKRVETKDVSLANAAVLVKAGVKDGLAAEEGALGLGAQEELALSAGLAVKGGLDRATALRAVTLTAAEVLGVADRVGSLEPGKDADVVVLERRSVRLPDPRQGRPARRTGPDIRQTHQQMSPGSAAK